MHARRPTATTSGTVAVGTTSEAVLADNPSRLEVFIRNDGANKVYLQLALDTGTAPTAVVGEGVVLEPSGTDGSHWHCNSYTGPIAGIAVTAETDVTVVEI